MLEQGQVWFVLADGRRARVLALQPRDELEELEQFAGVVNAAARGVSGRGASLAEQEALEISENERLEAQDRPPRSFDRAGVGRHAMDQGRDLHEEEEARFLKRVAERLAEAEQAGAYQHLVIAAPPRALGRLRAVLPQPVKARVRAELAKDVLDEAVPQLRERLRESLRA